MYKIVLTKQAVIDAKKLESSNLKNKTLHIMKIIRQNPFAFPPSFETLKAISPNVISRRINKKHRLVYQVLEEQKIIKILRMWTHYE